MTEFTTRIPAAHPHSAVWRPLRGRPVTQKSIPRLSGGSLIQVPWVGRYMSPPVFGHFEWENQSFNIMLSVRTNLVEY